MLLCKKRIIGELKNDSEFIHRVPSSGLRISEVLGFWATVWYGCFFFGGLRQAERCRFLLSLFALLRSASKRRRLRRSVVFLLLAHAGGDGQ